MTVEIVVCSRVTAEGYCCDAPWACVSIANTPHDLPELDAEGRLGLLQLAFVDVTSARDAAGHAVFSERMACELLDFVEEMWPRVAVLMVHCDAGISRSSAVAAAIARIFGGDEEEFHDEDLYDPNPLVYGVLLAVHEQRDMYWGSALG